MACMQIFLVRIAAYRFSQAHYSLIHIFINFAEKNLPMVLGVCNQNLKYDERGVNTEFVQIFVTELLRVFWSTQTTNIQEKNEVL